MARTRPALVRVSRRASLIGRAPSAGSAHGLEALDAGLEHLVAGTCPPVGGGKDLHLLWTAVAGRLDPAADPREIDDAVTHHAAIEQEVARRHQPVADMMGQDSIAGARDLALEVGIPPYVIGVDGDADAVTDLVADVEGLRERVHARAVRGVHGMQ